MVLEAYPLVVEIEVRWDRSPAGRSRVRFHPHGHRASISAIGREVFDLSRETGGDSREDGLLLAVALLEALDSVLWDQNGCLSSRIHFVERDAGDGSGPSEYAGFLAGRLRLLGEALPRGNWPLRPVRDTFDRCKALERTGGVPTDLR